MNYVRLHLEDYNELRDFKSEISAGKIGIIHDAYYQADFLTKEKALVESIERNNALNAHNILIADDLSVMKKELGDFRKKNPKPKEPELFDIRKISFWQFISMKYL